MFVILGSLNFLSKREVNMVFGCRCSLMLENGVMKPSDLVREFF